MIPHSLHRRNGGAKLPRMVRVVVIHVGPIVICLLYTSNFIDENDTGGHLRRLLEQIPHAAGTHTHKHLHKVSARDGKEGHKMCIRDRQ